MVAGGVGGDTGAELIGGEVQERVCRAADLEGAGFLEVFGFEAECEGEGWGGG